RVARAGASAGSVEDFAPGIEAAFPKAFEECEYQVQANGALPDFVRGTYYFNGPARFGSGDLTYRHWLDGAGKVASLRFANGVSQFKQRYSHSLKFEEQGAIANPLFSTIGIAFARSQLNRVNNRLESPVKVSVYPSKERLPAFGEQGLPWDLDPDTLENR